MSSTAVVILNFNGQKHLRQFLPSVLNNTPNAEVFVVDNASEDDSLAILEKEFPSVKTIRLPENLGYAGGYNQALRLIEADYYLILNSDVEVTNDWLVPLTQFLDANPDCAAVQPKILDYKKKTHFEYAGAAGGFIDILGYPFCRGRIFETVEKDEGQYDNLCKIHWCSGACFMIRKSVFHEVGGFDAEFFAHMEEIDLCWRLMLHGYHIYYLPESHVYHLGGGTLSNTSPYKTYLNFRNNLSMILKNMPSGSIWIILLMRVVLDWLAALFFWKDKGFGHFKAVLKAQWSFIKTAKGTYKRRSKQRYSVELKSSILFKYYVLRKKSYAALNNTK